jgi:hypothetical protein
MRRAIGASWAFLRLARLGSAIADGRGVVCVWLVLHSLQAGGDFAIRFTLLNPALRYDLRCNSSDDSDFGNGLHFGDLFAVDAGTTIAGLVPCLDL